MRVFAWTAVVAAMISPAAAQDLQSMQVATALGSVIGSEELCELSYDQEAIAAYIESKVSADDMSFPSTLQMMVQAQQYQLTDMSESAKTAHCTQIARAAQSFNFIE
ncbi:signal recognition particle [Devosia sp. XGJD_8]|uniref:signal recognition particle n=1 Tax=Devosia sp. XGJD_8 TaxID=3391187 RepID=UPI003984951C